MKDPFEEVTRLMAEDEVFQALSRAALKARAQGLLPGEIIAIGPHAVVVQKDETGDGMVVQSIVSQEHLESLAETKASQIGLDLSALKGAKGAEGTRSLLDSLARVLKRGQAISIRKGPGENLTFEKAVYKKH
jgi:hypothetical protein